MATGDLYKVYRNIVGLIQSQHKHHLDETARQLTRVGLHVNTPFYALLIGKVTTFALNKLSDELARSRHDDFPRVCTGTFTQSMGLPCAHTLRQLHADDRQIPLSAIHRHWYYLPDSRPVADQAVRQLLHNPLLSLSVIQGMSEHNIVIVGAVVMTINYRTTQ